MDNSQDKWLETGARFGHFTKGLLYGLIGALALQVSVGRGGQVAGQEEAARVVERQPFGVVLLVAVAVGLFGYAGWRLLEGLKGSGAAVRGRKGAAHRAASIVSGLVNGALAVAVAQMAAGSGSGGGAQSWVGKLLAQPFGALLLGAVGAAVIVAGLVQFYKAYTKRFLEDFRTASMSSAERRWVTRAGQVGYSARGVVFPIIGIGLLQAALQHDPGETRGTREALLEIASSGHGQLLLGLVAIGLLSFGLFMMASARYRRISARA